LKGHADSSDNMESVFEDAIRLCKREINFKNEEVQTITTNTNRVLYTMIVSGYTLMHFEINIHKCHFLTYDYTIMFHYVHLLAHTAYRCDAGMHL
jgi:hypothetical protein